MLIVVLKLCGQPSGEPNAVDDQSKDLVNVAISPAPWKKFCLEEFKLFANKKSLPVVMRTRQGMLKSFPGYNKKYISCFLYRWYLTISKL